jgi:hypothetical protein
MHGTYIKEHQNTDTDLTKDNKQDTNETDNKYTETKHNSNETKQCGRKINIKYRGKSPKAGRNIDNLK